MADPVCHVKAVQYQLQPAVGYCPAAVWQTAKPPEVRKSWYRATACAAAGLLPEAPAGIYLWPGNVLYTHKAEISVNPNTIMTPDVYMIPYIIIAHQYIFCFQNISVQGQAPPFFAACCSVRCLRSWPGRSIYSYFQRQFFWWLLVVPAVFFFWHILINSGISSWHSGKKVI